MLWTGILGGAIAGHVRVEDPLFSHTLLGVHVGILLWLGLRLRGPELPTPLPLVR